MHPLLKPAGKHKPRRLVVTVWGSNKTGKSHFYLTFPGPLHILNFDRSVEDIEWKFPDKEIYRFDIDLPKLLDAAECARILLSVDEVLDQSCKELQAGGGGTLAFDTTSILWTIVQKVSLQPIKEKKSRTNPDEVRVMPFQYADANLYMGSLLRRVLQYPLVNAVFVNNCSDVYNESGQPTGQIGFHGWKAIHGVSQLTLQMLAGSDGFGARIDVCRFDPTNEGLVLSDPSYELFKGMFLDD